MENIKEKASYCLNCKVKPCSVKGCPLNNNIPAFIEKVKEEKFVEAYKILSETTVLPGVCGRICPHFKQCQGSCVRGIKGEPVNIGELEAYVFDKATEQGFTLKDCFKEIVENNNTINQDNNSENCKNNTKLQEIDNTKKVAIIGGGPAGLTCAAFLTKKGVQVTIYEKYDYLGGLLVHGIPEFRLSREVINKTIKMILDLGISVKYNAELGKNIQLQDLQQHYDAVFLSFGANVSSKMGVEGEDLQGVFGGNELLEYNLHPNYKGKIACVVGGGNVAMDCARTIKRLGAKEVKVIYRRSREEMPAETKEIEDAINEGIEFLYQNNIVRIIGDKIQVGNSSSKVSETIEKEKVKQIELIKTELIQKEGETRKVPVNIEKSNYIINADYVVMALGSKPQNIVNSLGLELDKWQYIKVNENYQTSNPKIFAGGDLAGTKSTVAWAAKTGREAANSIERFLNI